MPSTPRRLSTAIAVGTLMGMFGLTAACSGGGDNAAACTSMQKSIQDLGATSMSQVNDPAAMAKTYHDQAAAIRTTANGASGDVKTAGLQVAEAMDGLGAFVGNLSSSTSTTPQMPDQTPLISAGTALQKACT